MIDFIFGDAGTGKSTYIYKWLDSEALAHPDRSYFLFVPEQNTLQAQKAVIRHSARHGMLNLDVLSFQLLAYRVMQELGIRQPVLLDAVSKSLLIRKSALEAAGNLRIYKNKIAAAGFTRQLGTLFSELAQYGVEADDLNTASGGTENELLKGKLSDIGLIYSIFREKLGENLAMPEDIASVLLKHIAASRLLKGAVVVFDGYTGFTPVQLKILEFIIPEAARARFAVTIPRNANPYAPSSTPEEKADMYYLSRETVRTVTGAAEKNGIQKGEDIYIEDRTPHPRVTVKAFASQADEVKWIARSMRARALRNGTRYRKMAALSADISSYADAMQLELEREEIPYFIDNGADATGDPSAGLLRSALYVVTRGCAYEDVMRYLRNPLNSVVTQAGGTADDENASLHDYRDRLDRLDNELRATGAAGRTAADRVTKEYGFDLSPVFNLHDAMKGDVASMTAALRVYWGNCDVPGRAEAYAEILEKRGYGGRAAECRRFAGLIPELFARIEHVLGAETVSAAEYVKLLEAGFVDMKGNVIPETMDMVTVVDLKRSRLDDIDVLYLMGAAEGELPAAVTGGGLLDDYERSELIESAALKLAPDDKTDSGIQAFYLKLMMNKPARELVITYSMYGADGKSRLQSSVISEIYQYVEAGDDSILYDKQPDKILASSEDDTLELLSSIVSEKNNYKTAKRLADIIRETGGIASGLMADNILKAAGLRHGTDRISASSAGKLYGRLLKGSITRLETYEKCPFRFFMQYGLDLKVRQEHTLKSVDLGTVYHDALNMAFSKIRRSGREIYDLSDDEIAALSKEVSSGAISGYREAIFDYSAKYRYISLKAAQTVFRTLTVLKRQQGSGSFKNKDTEVKFSHRTGRLDLNGKIDRLDAARDGDDIFIKIIDYKSGNKKFDISSVLDGIDMQLTAYMDNAVREARAAHAFDVTRPHIVPAAMLYYHIDDPAIPVERISGGASLESERLDRLKLNGAVIGREDAIGKLDSSISGAENLKSSAVIDAKSEVLSEEQFRLLMDYINDRMENDAAVIMNGDVNIFPYDREDVCMYCDYGGICRNKSGIGGFKCRRRGKKKTDFLEAGNAAVPGDDDMAEMNPAAENLHGKNNAASDSAAGSTDTLEV